MVGLFPPCDATVDWESVAADLFHTQAKAGTATAIISTAAPIKRIISYLLRLAVTACAKTAEAASRARVVEGISEAVSKRKRCVPPTWRRRREL